jgi:hypothetical protein
VESGKKAGAVADNDDNEGVSGPSYQVEKTICRSVS